MAALTLAHPLRPALKAARRPVMITTADVVEEQLSLQNLRALLGGSPTLLCGSSNPFPSPVGLAGATYESCATKRMTPDYTGVAMPFMDRMGDMITEIDVRKHPYVKYVANPKRFLDSIRSGKVPVGNDMRLIWLQA